MSKLLYDAKWLKLYKNDHDFVYAQRKGKDSVAVLCYKKNKDDNYEFLIHYQPLIALDPINNSKVECFPCLVTGSIENGEIPLTTALRELKEETGLVNDINLKPIKNYEYVSSTQMDEIVTIFIFDVTNKEFLAPETDGSYYEQISWNQWVSEEEFKAMVFNKTNPNLACLTISYLLFTTMKNNN